MIFWTPLLRERLSTDPLVGKIADRGADVTKAEGLRQEILVEAEDWLRGNISPTDVTITGLPRQLAWYADLGVDGMGALIDLNSQPRTEEQKRQYILDRLGPTGAAYDGQHLYLADTSASSSGITDPAANVTESMRWLGPLGSRDRGNRAPCRRRS